MKQIDTGSFLGYMKLLAQQVFPYLQVLILLFTGISAYVPISAWFSKQGIEFPFWMFVVVVFIIVIMVCLLEYFIIFPSYFNSVNKQTWEHENPVRKEFEKLNKRLDEMEERMEKLG